MPDEEEKMTGPERGSDRSITVTDPPEPDWYENYLCGYAEALSGAPINLNAGMNVRQYAAIAIGFQDAKIAKCAVRSRAGIANEIDDLLQEKETP